MSCLREGRGSDEKYCSTLRYLFECVSETLSGPIQVLVEGNRNTGVGWSVEQPPSAQGPANACLLRRFQESWTRRINKKC